MCSIALLYYNLGMIYLVSTSLSFFPVRSYANLCLVGILLVDMSSYVCIRLSPPSSLIYPFAGGITATTIGSADRSAIRFYLQYQEQTRERNQSNTVCLFHLCQVTIWVLMWAVASDTHYRLSDIGLLTNLLH